MDDNDHSTTQQAKAQKTSLTLVVAIIYSSDGDSRKNGCAIREIQLVLAQIAASLPLIPLEYRPRVHCTHTL
jgi:hypothetical protein